VYGIFLRFITNLVALFWTFSIYILKNHASRIVSYFTCDIHIHEESTPPFIHIRHEHARTIACGLVHYKCRRFASITPRRTRPLNTGRSLRSRWAHFVPIIELRTICFVPRRRTTSPCYRSATRLTEVVAEQLWLQRRGFWRSSSSFWQREWRRYTIAPIVPYRRWNSANMSVEGQRNDMRHGTLHFRAPRSRL